MRGEGGHGEGEATPAAPSKAHRPPLFFFVSGFLKFVVHNEADLDLLLMHNRTYAAEIAHNVSARKRAAIVARAAQLNVNVTNGAAKLRSQEEE